MALPLQSPDADPDVDVESCQLIGRGEDTCSTSTWSRCPQRFRFGVLALGLSGILCAAVFLVRSSSLKAAVAAEDTPMQKSAIPNKLKLQHDLDEFNKLIEKEKSLMSKAAKIVKPQGLPVKAAVNPQTKPLVVTPAAASSTTREPSAPASSTSPSNSTIWKDPLSMFCFMVIIPSELQSVRWQFEHGVGIFQCTSWRVYTREEPLLIGRYADGTAAKTTSIPGPKAFFGKAYFWGCNHSTKYLMNANILERAWDHAKGQGVAGLHSWIIKVDPDSVFSPGRLRKILSQRHFDQKDETKVGRYFKNCKVMGSMQGSMEILSRQAFYVYTGKKAQCQQSMDWWHMGEDIFTFKCLQQLGVEASDIFEGVADTYCAKSKSCVQHQGRPNCSLPDVAIFHPLKELDEFQTCWKEVWQVEDQSSKRTSPGSIFA